MNNFEYKNVIKIYYLQIQMYHCVCEGQDGCNGAEQSTFTFALLILPLIPAYIFHISG